MRYLLKISLFILIPLFAKAQIQRKIIDSLKQVFLTAINDSNRYTIANNISFLYSESNSDSSLHYSKIALSVAHKNSMELDVALKLTDIGYQQYKLYRYGESLKNFLSAAKIAEDPTNETKVFSHWKYANLQNNRLEILGKLYNTLGHLMGRTGDTAQQISYYTKAYTLFKKIGNDERCMLMKQNFGILYINLGKLDSALLFQQEALAIASIIKQTKEFSSTSLIFYYTGNIYLKKGNKEKALENWHKAILSNPELNQRVLISIYGSLSAYYQDEKNKDSSLYYAKKQLAIIRFTESPNIELAYTNMYKSFELNSNKDSASFYKGLALAATEKTLQERVKNLNDFQKEVFKEQEKLQQLEKEKIELKNKQKNYGLLGVLAVFLIIALLQYRNNRQKQKANLILQEQKDKVETTLQELKATQSQLIQSEKMASLGELTAGIAHEIQNPLNFVNNFSELNVELIEEVRVKNEELGVKDADLTDLLNDIKANSEKINYHGKRADGIVKGMLQHSRSSTGQKEPTDINALCDEYLRLAYHGLRAKDKTFNAEFKTEFDESIGKVNVQPQEMGRVILNLINNAFFAVSERYKEEGKSSKEDGAPSGLQLTPSSSNPTPYTPAVMVTTKKLDNYVEIRVYDNGTGIPQHIKEKIFQPFFTTKPTGQGTGLGLSLAYDIVTKVHGGKLEVGEGNPEKFGMESETRTGTTFVVTIPT